MNKILVIFVLLLITSSILPLQNAHALGLIWEGVSKSGSKIGDIADVSDGCINGQTLTFQTSNSTWICTTSSVSSGTYTAIDTVSGTTILAYNSTTTALFKNFLDSTYILWTNGTNSLTATLQAIPESMVTNLTTDLGLKQSTSEKNANNGYAGLGSSGQLQIANQNGTTEYNTNKNQNNGYAGLGSSGQLQIAQQNGTTEYNTNKGVASGYASLNSNTLVPSPQLASGNNGTSTFLTGDRVWGTIKNTLLDGSNHTDTTAQTVSRGSLITGSAGATSTWDELVVGAGGSFLYTNGTDDSWKTFQVWNQTTTSNQYIQGINNATGVISTQILAGTGGISITAGTFNYTRIYSLSNNVTAGDVLTGSVNNQTHVLVMSIPLTASSGNLVTGMLNTVTNVTGVAPQYGINSTQANTKGTCYFSTPTTSTATTIDNINVINTGLVVDTAETTWFSSLEIPQSVQFSCSVVTGSTAGNLQVWLKPEAVASTKAQVRAVAGSYYQMTP